MLDHEIRLFRELEAIKQSSKDSTHVLKALRFIDRKRRDGMDKKQLLAFLNSNMDDSQLKPSDMTTIFKRLSLKQTGLINYIDFYNAIYAKPIFTDHDDGVKAVKAQKLKKNFITLIDKEAEEFKTQKDA